MYKVLDTNIVLEDAYNIITLGKDGSIIVLPETVIDELDAKKSGFTEIAFQAREFGRLLTQATDLGVTHHEDLTITSVALEGVEIHIASCSKYPSFEGLEANVINDRRIIHIAQVYKQPVTFITNDIACRHRAKSLNIKVTDLKLVARTDLTFVRTVMLSDDIFRTVHNMPILDVDPGYKPNFFNYKFVNTLTEQMKLATIVNSTIQVIGKTTEDDLRRQDITPANAEQLFFSKALQDTTININICEAKAGSGKTALAISNGIRMVRQGKYDSIIYIRASVDDVDRAEEVGFLSGNDEKMQVYLHPLEDTLDFIVRNRFKKTKMKADELERKVVEEVEKLKESCNMQALIGLGLRGRTFHNSYIIIDEAQNQSKASLQKMLTRIGQDCKIVVVGSNRQIDNPYITKYTNGLSTLLEACTKEHENVSLHAVNLPKVLRGPIAEFAESIYS